MLVCIQNDHEVPLGAFAGYLAEAGTPHAVVHPYRGEVLPQINEASAVIVLGGAMGVHDTGPHPFLVDLKIFVKKCVAAKVPLLGVCLGGQLLADVLGGSVSAGTCGEKGTLTVSLTPEGMSDPLFAGVPEEFVTFQWHNDCFAIPGGAVLLASSAACAGQAFRFGTNAYGLQFHPEVDRTVVDCWARWSSDTAPTAGEYLAAFAEREEQYRAASRRLLENFIRIVRTS
jgi:GMP synthase-like glutamine amidotransferase